VKVVRPDHIARNIVRNPRLLLALHVAVADVRQPQRAVAIFAKNRFAENLSNGSAYGAKADQSHAARMFGSGSNAAAGALGGRSGYRFRGLLR